MYWIIPGHNFKVQCFHIPVIQAIFLDNAKWLFTNLNDCKTTFLFQEGVGPEGSRGARVVWAVNMKYLFISAFNK